MDVYLVRGPRGQIDAALRHESVARHTKPTAESQKMRGHLRASNGFMLSRAILSGPPPADTHVVSWRHIGSTAASGSPTFTPLMRCKRDHAPLRYLTNNGCVYCARKQKKGGVRLRLQVPLTAKEGFDETVNSMGWKIVSPLMRRETMGRLLVLVEVDGTRDDAVEVCRALGWEVCLWW